MPDGFNVFGTNFPLISSLDKSSSEWDNYTEPKQEYDRHGQPLSQTAEQLQFKEGAVQWLRKIKLTVYASTEGGDKGSGIDLSQLRVDFRVTKQTSASPNFLDLKVYNLAPETVSKVRQFKKVQLSAGYQSNLGMIFDGNVVLYISGKDNPVDTHINIIAGDQDIEVNNEVANLSFPAGALANEKIRQALEQAKRKIGEISPGDSQKTLRSSHYLGSTDRFLRNIMNETNSDLFMDDGKTYVISRTGYRKGEIVKLSPTTGLVGFPKVTPSGIEAQCLLNPKLRLGGLVEIETSSLSDLAFEPGGKNPYSSAGAVPFAATLNYRYEGASISPTGIYKILLLSHHGDTRGNPWYSELVCTASDSSGKELKVDSPGTAFARSVAKYE